MTSRTARLVRLLVAAAIVMASVLLPTASAEAAIDASLQVTKTASAPGPFVPGQPFSYTITSICSSPTASGCINAQLTDTLPAPLAFDPAHPTPVTASVAGGGTTTVSHAGSAFTVDFTKSLGGGDVGLQQARLATITVWVKVADGASADYNGTITNTAQVTADNAATKTASAPVTVAVTSTLAIDVTKARTSAATVPSVPGTAVTWEIGGTNTSNKRVDTLVLQDPAEPLPAVGPFEHLALTGLDPFTAPAGADGLQVEWADPGGAWTTSYDGPLPVPGGTAALLPADPASIYGIRFRFTSSTGSIPVGASADVGLQTETRANVVTIPDGTTVTVDNTVDGHVSSGAADSAVDQANASVSIANQPPTVITTKSFDRDDLLGGETAIAVIRSDNGDLPVHEMTIAEPGPAGDDLAEQGLDFQGFDATNIEWPVDATSASITYTYAGGGTQTLSTTTVDTLPPPTGDVTSFSVTFTAPGDGIEPSAYAVLPFRVVAEPVIGTVPVTSTNTTRTTVTDTQSRTGSDNDTATIDRLPVQVDTHVGKSFTPTELYAAAGATTLVSLTASVAQRPESTVGSDYLAISDPNGSPGAAPSAFWACFTVRNITNTDVPAGSRLTVSYWDGTAWAALTSQTGPTSNWSYTVPAGTRAAVRGLRFEFRPTTPGAVLSPGFNVAPNFNAVVRPECATATTVDPTVVNNTVESEVANSANGLGPVTAAADADLTLHPLLGGTGPRLVEKTWVDPDVAGSETDPVTAGALTGDVRTAKLKWSTGGLAFDSVAISDPASQAELDQVSDSIYEAFDLDRILPITSAQDPHIADDEVSGVELYSDSADAWIDVTAAACSAGCVGEYGGYDVPAGSGVGQEDDVIGVRLTITSRTSGEPVSISSAHDRLVRLDLRLRDTKRSTPSEYVLGQHHPGMTYNTGTPGLVRNSVEVAGTGAHDWADSDTADAVVIDKPLNVELTKAFEYTPLGLPPVGTPQAGYPLVDAVLEATNRTASRVSTLQITDPAPGTAVAASVFDTLNIFSITAIDLPAGVDPTDVEVDLTDAGGTTTPYTYTAALALTSTALADVVGVAVKATGTIETEDVLGLRLTFQLRGTERVSGEPMDVTDGAPDPVHTNVAQADVEGPGGISCATYGAPCDAVQVQADDQFQIVPVSYDVVAGKSISPATRYEDQPATGYVATLSGQPTGSARTTVLTLTDDDPRFWNAFDFAGVEPFTAVGPVNQLRLSVLTGVDYGLSGSDLVATCGGLTDLSACWTTGTWTGAVGGTISLALPGGISAADVRGVRVEARSVRSGSPVGWERPNNQRVAIRLDVTRRANLAWSSAGTNTTPVPSTLPGMSSAPGEPTQGTMHDDLDVHGVASWELGGGTGLTADDDASATTQLLHRVNKIRVQKAPGNPGTPPLYENGAVVPYSMTITNTGAYTMTAPAFTVTDQITPIGGASPVTAPLGDASFTFALFNQVNVSQPVTGITGHLDATTGLVTVGFPSGFQFPSGYRLVISAGLTVRADLPAGTEIHNSVTASADRDFEECRSTTDEQTEHTTGSAASPVATCTATTRIEVRADAPLQMTKWVKGVGAGVPGAPVGSTNENDLGVLAHNQATAAACTPAAADADGFYTYPCVPITRPGGTERWKIGFQNDGNVNAGVVAGIDVLPRLGDEGVIVPVGRGSQWAPTLIGNFSTNLASLADGSSGDLKLFYTNTVADNACNEADIRATTRPGGLPVGDPCAADVAGRTWLPVTGAPDLSHAKAIKVVLIFGDASDPAEPRGLRPGEELQLEFDTRTAPYADAGSSRADGLSIAWNSVAAGSRNVGSGSQPASASLVTEPRQVGVAMPTGQLDITKVVDAPSWPSGVTLPADYPFTVSCDSAGATDIPLVAPGGADRSSVTVPAGGTIHYNGGAIPATSWSRVSVPWNATCTVAEDPAAQGASVGYDPAGATVVADADLTGFANIHHPFPPTGTGTPEVTATNTYASGGFSVTKTVDAGGAVDEAGDPITYGPFGFTATCTFLGQEVLLPTDQAFTVAAGATRAMTGVPAGADCTVTEVGADGAQSTDIAVTQGGITTPGTAGSVDFTVVSGGPSATTVEATNTFTTGSLEVTKSIDGPGAALWGDRSFTVHLTCTLDGDTVYDGDSPAIDAGHLVWTVDDLATGASCTVTEPGAGGANATTITPAGPITVGDGTTAAVGVTNTFELGALTVSKVLAGPAAGVPGAQNGKYTMELTCTREVNGTDVAVAIPGGARRVITGEGSATYHDLPTDARCSIAEVASNPSTPHVVVTPSSVVIEDDPADPVEVVVTNAFHDGALQLSKRVDGASAAVAPGSFDLHVTCDFPVGAPVALPDAGLVTVDADGTPVTLGALPTGSQCRISEADAGQTAVTYAPSDLVTIGDGTATPVVVTNVYRSGALAVVKDLTGVGAGVARGPFVFAVGCTYRGLPVLDATVSVGVTALRSDPVVGMPVGASCTITETDPGDAVAPGPPVTVTITDGSDLVPVVAHVANGFGAGVLRISKAVDGRYGNEALGREFAVRVQCEYGAGAERETVLDRVVPVLGGRTVVVRDKAGDPVLLPAGASCWGQETEDLRADATTIDHGTRADAVIVDPTSTSGPARIGITLVNTFDHPISQTLPLTPEDGGLAGGGQGDGGQGDGGPSSGGPDHGHDPWASLPGTGLPVSPGLVLLAVLLIAGGAVLVQVGRSRRRP